MIPLSARVASYGAESFAADGIGLYFDAEKDEEGGYTRANMPSLEDPPQKSGPRGLSEEA